MLYFISLGLGDETDITIKGKNCIELCDIVYLDHYTAILGVDIERLNKFHNKQIILADRELIESGTEILNNSLQYNVALLVVGDCFAATTHHDLYLRAVQQNIQINVVHNASIINGVGICGLQLYRYGECVSIPYFTAQWKPISFYHKIKSNTLSGLHTLCLLDIRVKEQLPEDIAKNNKIYQPPRYMTINQSIHQLLDTHTIIYNQHVNGNNDQPFIPAYTGDTCAFGVARIGSSTEQIISGTLNELLLIDFGLPLHSLILCGTMHDMELDMYNHYHWNKQQRIHDKQQELIAQQNQLAQQNHLYQQQSAQRIQQQQYAIQQNKQLKQAAIQQKLQQQQQQHRIDSNESDDDTNGGIDMSISLFD